jgi:hypothetical protein
MKWNRGLIVCALVLAGCSGGSGRPQAVPSVSALPEVITPDAARQVFDELWTDTRKGGRDRLEGAGALFAAGILKSMKGFDRNPVTDVKVGVPPGQTAFPAYFVATAATEVKQDDMTLHFYSLLTKVSADRPWTMVEFRAAPSADHVPRPAIGADGRLAAVPSGLVVEPARLPELYAGWFNASQEAGVIVDDPLLRVEGERGALAQMMRQAGVTEGRLPTFRVYSAKPSVVRPELVPLSDGRVLVSFSAIAHSRTYNNDQPVTRSCKSEWLTLEGGDPKRYRHTWHDATMYVVAYVPSASGGSPAPAPAGSPAPDPATSPVPDPSTSPVPDPSIGRILVQDNATTDWKGRGQPC